MFPVQMPSVYRLFLIGVTDGYSLFSQASTSTAAARRRWHPRLIRALMGASLISTPLDSCSLRGESVSGLVPDCPVQAERTFLSAIL